MSGQVFQWKVSEENQRKLMILSKYIIENLQKYSSFKDTDAKT